MSKYEFFWKKDSPFSQHFRTPGVTQFTLDGQRFECGEQAMMYQKAVLMQDMLTAQVILETPDPNIVKRLGRQVKNFDQLKWDAAKWGIVYNINLAKFTQNPGLKKTLIATGTKTLVEASPYDTIWGIGMTQDDPRAQDPRLWKGQNLLGYILTDVRNHIKSL